MRFDGVMILGKELRRDRDRAIRELWARSAAAAVVWRELGAQTIVTLEAPLQGQPEAGSDIVVRMLGELGVPRAAIHQEWCTRSTREEALGLRRVADLYGWGRVLALTSAYHVPRSRRYFFEVLGRDRVAVMPPEVFSSRARPVERQRILEGAPHPEAMDQERRVEATFLALSRVLRPLPGPLRWELEVLAGGVYRGIDGLRTSRPPDRSS